MLEIEKIYFTHEDVDIYPDKCIICLNSFSVVFLPVNKYTHVMKMKGYKRERKRIESMVCSIYFFHFDLG